MHGKPCSRLLSLHFPIITSGLARMRVDIRLFFWTILSSWLLLRALQQARPQLWIAYAPAAALGVYTHMTMLFVILGHFSLYLMTLFVRRREIWPHRWQDSSSALASLASSRCALCAGLTASL